MPEVLFADAAHRGLAETTNLPGVTSYRCEPCNETAVVEDREVRR